MTTSKPLLEEIVDTIAHLPSLQNPLLSAREFERYLRERSITIVHWIGMHTMEYIGLTGELEWFEQSGLVYPLFRIPSTHSIVMPGELNSYRDQGLILYPEVGQFKSWKSYYESEGQRYVSFYHPYQSLLVKQIYRYVLRMPLVALSPTCWIQDDARSLRNIQSWQEEVGERIRSFRQSGKVMAFYKVLKLLLVLQEYYLPGIRRRLVTSMGENQQWYDWRWQLNLTEILENSELNIDELKKWQDHAALEAQRVDPLRDWYLLIRHASYEKKQKLKGAPLLAQSFYEISEMLRHFIFDTTGEELPAEDNLSRYPSEAERYWTKKRYGVEEITYKDRSVLRRILREFDLDPQYKVYWFIEGDTEEHFIERFAKSAGIDLEGYGIKLINMKGADKFVPKQLERFLRDLKSQEVFIFALLDRHAHVPKVVQKMADFKRHKQPTLLYDFEYQIWQEDFETDNFPEIPPHTWDEHKKGRRRGIFLADYLVKKIRSSDRERSEAEMRPIERVLLRVLRMTYADYRFSVEMQQANSGSE
jgi:hypothetical protein